jgi:NAD(P)-dependent dehydrogenase (short-subunit alcohol dehydrogenase family)
MSTPDVVSASPSSRPLLPLLAGGAIAASYLLTHRRPRYSLRDRTVLITGGSRGLGLVLAREAVRAGARVAICGRDLRTLARARADLERRGGQVLAVECNVMIQDEVDRFVRHVEELWGPIHVVINNAGVITAGPVETMALGDFHQAMDTNFWGALYTVLAVMPGMKRRGEGRIVNVASIGGKLSVPHLLPYCASKFALVGLSEGLRAELAKDGITVITVCPGLMRTGSPRHALFKGRHRAEYAWFSISDALPGLSMDADRAARQIIDSIRRGEAERVLSAPAKIAAVVRALAPNATAELVARINRLLPPPDQTADEEGRKGEASTSAFSPSLLTVLGERAAARNNQLPDAI